MSKYIIARVEMEEKLKLHENQPIHGGDKTPRSDPEKALSEIATMEPTHPMGFVGTVADQVWQLLLLQRHSTAREEAVADNIRVTWDKAFIKLKLPCIEFTCSPSPMNTSPTRALPRTRSPTAPCGV